ncbi:glycosyltransferase family 10 protein [Gonapodya prolifera JEL478]|uniref:Fucosyltransferase n=1 Tax=Gonapodya prolifera (strain JEL478) TaxID=1344416 RepID=A0A139A370_GONPJ|nr:glycosyltransferase family 10 protein [Gonapodya prolifera JEL478]|eukprot:KXS11210.1 glycosyltransferase family 10 protein [Gonapodya prolifera JEL478]
MGLTSFLENPRRRKLYLRIALLLTILGGITYAGLYGLPIDGWHGAPDGGDRQFEGNRGRAKLTEQVGNLEDALRRQALDAAREGGGEGRKAIAVPDVKLEQDDPPPAPPPSLSNQQGQGKKSSDQFVGIPPSKVEVQPDPSLPSPNVEELACSFDPTTRDLKKYPITLCDEPYLRHDKDQPKGTNCPVPYQWTSRCEEADLRIFEVLHGGIQSVVPKAERKCAHQKYGYLSMESAAYYGQVMNAKDYVDVVSTYRLDSDVPMTYWGGFMDIQRFSPVPLHKRRTDAIAATFVSNCGALNDRNKWMEGVSQVVPTHHYGTCFHNQAIPERIKSKTKDHPWDLKYAVLEEYLFNLCFENSDSPYYVTEKLYQAYVAGVVPVYLGPSNWQLHVPNLTSLIMASDFDSPEQLGHYLKYLSENSKEYERYLEWKKYPMVRPAWKEIERIAAKDVHCRFAMHVAGKPYKWRNKDFGAPETMDGDVGISVVEWKKKWAEERERLDKEAAKEGGKDATGDER